MATKLYGKRKWPTMKAPDSSKRGKPKKGREQKMNDDVNQAVRRRGEAPR